MRGKGDPGPHTYCDVECGHSSYQPPASNPPHLKVPCPVGHMRPYNEDRAAAAGGSAALSPGKGLTLV